ncbi:MAG: ribosomal protein S18-alanine N-acetyltransferase [Hyphomicrobium sp.]
MSDNVTPLRNIKHVSLLWADPERAVEIAALHARLFDPAWDETAVKSLLEHPASTSLVAVTGDPKTMVGFVIGQLAADQAEIISIAVAPEWRRFGLGRMLVEGLARASRRGDAKRLFLEVAEDNTAALLLYQSLGFSEAARRKGYYQRGSGVAVDALILSLKL